MMNSEGRVNYVLIGIVLALLLSACADPPATKRVPSPSPPAPLPADGERITKPVDVSFSTYSKNWPVGWLWIDPDERTVRTPHDVKKGVLSLTVPTGKDLAGENRSAPRYLKAIVGDFELETRVAVLPKENFQAAGILIYSSESDYIRLERSFAGPDGGEGIRLRAVGGGVVKELAFTLAHPDVTYLKVRREGATFSAFWRPLENAQWEKLGEITTAYSETVLAGLAAYNTAEPLTVEFAYIKLLPVK